MSEDTLSRLKELATDQSQNGGEIKDRLTEFFGLNIGRFDFESDGDVQITFLDDSLPSGTFTRSADGNETVKRTIKGFNVQSTGFWNTGDTKTRTNTIEVPFSRLKEILSDATPTETVNKSREIAEKVAEPFKLGGSALLGVALLGIGYALFKGVQE